MFVIEASEPELPEGLISLLRLLILSPEDWQKANVQNKPPKPKLDFASAQAAVAVLERRLTEYPTSLEVSNWIMIILLAMALNSIAANMMIPVDKLSRERMR